MSRTGLFFLLIGCVGVWPCVAQDSLTITTNHYLVTGSTLREIRQSINGVRPGGEKGTADALTTWIINWRTRLTSANGECRVTSFTAATAINVTVPKWRVPTNAAPEIVKKWADYYTALLKHEMTHATNGLLADRELRKLVAEIGSDSVTALDRSDGCRCHC